MTPTLLAALATTLLVGTAFAAPVLKTDIVVSAAVVTVGDMFVSYSPDGPFAPAP